MPYVFEIDPTPTPTSTPQATETTTTETQLIQLHDDMQDIKNYMAFDIGIFGIIVGVIVFKGFISRLSK